MSALCHLANIAQRKDLVSLSAKRSRWRIVYGAPVYSRPLSQISLSPTQQFTRRRYLHNLHSLPCSGRPKNYFSAFSG